MTDGLQFLAKTSPSSTVKTRTKDKYRVVYTDHQRLELEKEFHYSRYITIRRKTELAATLGLSERQVGITFPESGYYGLGQSEWVALESLVKGAVAF